MCYKPLETKSAVVQNKLYFSNRTENYIHQTLAKTKLCSFICQN